MTLTAGQTDVKVMIEVDEDLFVCHILNYKRNPSVTFLGNYRKIIKKLKYILYHIL